MLSLLLALLAAAPDAAASDDKCTLAVLDLEPGQGVEKSLALALSDVVTGEVGALTPCSVLSRSDVRGVLSFEAEKQLLGCSSDSSCLAELAGALGADYLVTGNVSRISGTMLLALRMTDLKSLKVTRRATDTFAGRDDHAIPFVGWMARKLMSDDKTVVGVKPEPAAVVASPAVAAATPAADVKPTTRGTVWGTLAWTGVVLTSVAAVVTAGAGGTTFGLSEYAAEVKRGSDPTDFTTLSTLDQWGPVAADVTNVALYTTAGLALVTAPFFFLPHEEPLPTSEVANGGGP